jgi:hypothetical protein
MIDLDDPHRLMIRRAANSARSQLQAAIAFLRTQEWQQSRIDRLQGPDGTEVETGYVYGESRLTVYSPQGQKTREHRLNGRSAESYHEFIRSLPV